jgi:precorrin-2 dehydrogenase/sirohydrochlorin ferrochelatase
MRENSRPSKSGADVAYYPLLLDISKKPCLVVGGGLVAERKVRMLLKFDARVLLVSPKVKKSLLRLAEKGSIEVMEREYCEGDLEGASLVFAATDVEEINRRIKAEAGERNIPVNVVDDPLLCDFIVPSIVKKGPITVAISTSGTLPSLSKKLRQSIVEEITDDYIKYARILGKVRKLLIDTEQDKHRRKTLLNELVKMDMKEVNELGFRRIKSRFLRSCP